MDSRPLTIAIADHDYNARHILSSFLAKCKYSVCLSVDNGQILIKKIEEHSFLPDICILDINMPDMDAFQTVMLLKQKWPAVKVLATSIHNQAKDICKIIQIGADDFLPKDCTKDELTITIRSLYRDSKR